MAASDLASYGAPQPPQSGAAMNYFNPNTPMGASVYNPPANYGEGDTNAEGAASDPFAYTSGSLLTPWQGRFSSSGYDLGNASVGASYQAAAYNPYQFDKFNYGPVDVGQFGETYADPAAFKFADFQGPSDFRAPTAEDMRADPGYQARMDAVRNAQMAGAAHGGVLRSGGFQKGLAQAVGNQASQEYGAVYNRRSAEHDRLRKEAEGNYGINQGNTFQAFNTNVGNRLNAYKTREQTWMDNANVGLRQGELNYNISTGTWDRNQGLSRQQWQDEAQHQQELAQAANATAASGAAAASANNRARYEADLQDYTRSRDEYWTNQDRQYAVLDREANRGYQAADRAAQTTMGGYNQMGDYAMGGANAQAAGTVARGNAYGNMFSDVGNSVGGYAMAGSVYSPMVMPRMQRDTRGDANPGSVNG